VEFASEERQHFYGKAPGNKTEEEIGQKVSLGYAWYALFILFLVNFFNYVDRMSIQYRDGVG